MWPRPLQKILEPFFGAQQDLKEDKDRLVLVHRQRSGCGGIFLLFWLGMWTYFLVTIGTQMMPDLSVREVLVLLLLAAVAIAAAVYLIWTSFGRDELRVEGGWVWYSRWALVRLRRRRMAASEVQMIDLAGDAWMFGDATIVISGGGGDSIRFGKGELPFVLVHFARKLRERVEQAAGRSLPRSVNLDEAQHREEQRQQRVLEGALAAAGVRSAEEIDTDAARQAVIEKMAGLYVEELRSPPRSRWGRLGREVFSWISAAMAFAGAVLWIWVTVVVTRGMYKGDSWGMGLIFLPVFWATSVYFGLAILVTIKEVIGAVVGWVRRSNHA